jgi:hypothetical protein
MSSSLPREAPPATERFVDGLLGAQDLTTLAWLADRELQGHGLAQVQLLWNHLPGEAASIRSSSGQPVEPATLALLETARRQGGRVQQTDPATGIAHVVQLLAQNTGLWIALSARLDPQRVDAAWTDCLAPLALRAQSLLYTQRLQVDVERLASAERLQRALFAISDIASSDLRTAEVLRGLHQIVGGLMYAENFYIVRFDPERQSIRFLYFADSHDPVVPDPDDELSPLEMGNSLTLHLLRHGKPVRGPSRSLRAVLSAPMDEGLGPDSEDWMGVPIVEDGIVRGAVVVQSYDPAVRYSEADQALLGYVAQHILSALNRRDQQAELERRVHLRTHELRR